MFRNGILTQSDVVVKQGDMIGGNSIVVIGGAQIFHGGGILFTIWFDVYGRTGALVLAQPQNVVNIQIQTPSAINTKSQGMIPVAILSRASFDAPSDVNTNSLTFGHTGDENSLEFCNPGGTDVNGDGLPDLVCHFDNQLAAFQPGDTSLILKGTSNQGTPFMGSVAIRMVH